MLQMRLKKKPDIGRRLMQAAYFNTADWISYLLAQGAQLRGRKWPGNFTPLHMAALSNCCSALPGLLEAAAKEGLHIDCRLKPMPLEELVAAVFRDMGFSGNKGKDRCYTGRKGLGQGGSTQCARVQWWLQLHFHILHCVDTIRPVIGLVWAENRIAA